MKSDTPGQRKKGKTVNIRWVVLLFLSTAVISAILSIASSTLLGAANLIAACCVLLGIIFVGVVFDMIGVAVIAADQKPFHAMASRRVPEARDAISLLRNAVKVSSFCNDVIGDVCSVISGTAAATLVVMAAMGSDRTTRILETFIAALVSGLTVGGKALGKYFALSRATWIIHTAAKVIYTFKRIPRAIVRRVRTKK